uniref:Uncharacterized protein n=1 Tax=Oryza glumipatula TaxID=40148 RepID=A0A0E0BJI5_9ORYZ
MSAGTWRPRAIDVGSVSYPLYLAGTASCPTAINRVPDPVRSRPVGVGSGSGSGSASASDKRTHLCAARGRHCVFRLGELSRRQPATKPSPSSSSPPAAAAAPRTARYPTVRAALGQPGRGPPHRHRPGREGWSAAIPAGESSPPRTERAGRDGRGHPSPRRAPPHLAPPVDAAQPEPPQSITFAGVRFARTCGGGSPTPSASVDATPRPVCDSSSFCPKVNGSSQIVITDSKVQKLGSSANYVKYYKGTVKFGKGLRIQTKASVLAFTSCDGEAAAALYVRLVAVNSPFTVKPLSYGRGIRRYREYTFLAVPPPSCLLSNYTDGFNDKTVSMKRFTEEFIKITGDIVRAIITLHCQGYWCSGLKGKHVCIYKMEKCTDAKIWSFCFAGGNEAKKSEDWVDLGKLLELAAKRNDSYTAEIEDLCKKLKNKTLRGMKVLKHSALLNVREKFENIIALNLFILVHVKNQPQVPSGDPEKDKIISELVKFMNASLQWAKAMPHWITQRSNYQAPTTETGLSFIDGLRDLFEHENEYIPEKVKQSQSEIQLVGRDPDLECQLRLNLEKIFLQAQNFVLELDIEY